jgi:hypothetical protein
VGGTTRWCAIAVGLLAVGCGGGGGDGGDEDSPTTTADTSTTTAPPAEPTYEVGQEALVSSSGIAELRIRTSPAG